MSDEFRIIPYQVRSAGTDVPPEEVQAAINSLAQQVTVDLNILAGQAQSPTGPAGGDLGGNYPNPTVVGLHVTTGTESGVTVTGNTINSSPIGQTTPAAGAFTTLTATTPVGAASGGTGQNTLSAHNVLLGEGTGAVGFAAPGTSGQILASGGAAVDPSFQTKAALTIASSGANSDITSLSALSTPLSVAQGGTGRATLTIHGVLIGETTGAINQTAAGTTGQALIGQTGADPVFGFPTGALINVQVFSAGGTYTNTAGTNSVIVEAVGAGGGSGGVAAQGAGSGALSASGGGGAYAKARFTSGFTGGIAVTIGTAGAAGTSGANAGGTGGATSLGTLVSCPGGIGGGGGGGSSSAAAVNGAVASAAPTITGAAQIIASQAGPSGFFGNQQAAGANGAGGQGGSSPLGAGGQGANATGAGSPGLGKGGGGGASFAGSSGAAQVGAAGTAGYLVVYEYA